MTVEQYLRDEAAKGVTEHKLVVTVNDYGMTALILPSPVIYLVKGDEFMHITEPIQADKS